MSIISSITSIASGGMSKVYKWLAILGVVLSIAVGSYFYGVHMESQKGKAEISAMKAKYEGEEADLLGLQTISTTRIVTQVVTKTVIIHDQANTINTLIPLVPDTQPLSVGWLSIYNASATGSEVDAASASDGSSSGTTASGALPTITNNNEVCRAQAVQLQGLIDYINAYNANVDEVNKGKR